ncbi:MAG TPA: rhamnulokinase family protein [Phototrophicaceae bacterium]|nr:rhamnulokinase family protein [Phototrophicaceae bacterium]
MVNVIAVDLGAESGRVARVNFDGSRFDLEEIHRFPNIPVQVSKTLHWDALRLWHEISTGIEKAAFSDANADAAGIGIDGWGVDFALLDRDGKLVGNPVHYRDTRTDGLYEWVFARVARREVFERTGIQFMIINTLYQLASMVAADSAQLQAATTYLSMPDLLNYWLTGEKTCEFTHATTTQMYNPRAGDWDRWLMTEVGIPADLFGAIVQPGTRIGAYRGIPVIAPATHDTGSAVVAVPTTTPNYAYLSSGTWSLIGLELDAPVITDAAYAANVTNEGGVNGTFRLLKNVMGLWIAQQCRATWKAQSQAYSYDDLTRLANDAQPFRSLVDPDDPAFLPPGDMPSRIREFCKKTNQPIPETPGQVMRTVYESLALKYRQALEDMIALSGRMVEKLHIIGGGTQNKLLCQMTADALGRVVVAGPVEATALGNAITQLIALGELGSVAQARTALSRTITTEVYEPKDGAAWTEAYERFQRLVKA